MQHNIKGLSINVTISHLQPPHHTSNKTIADDILFLMFYSSVGDRLQMAAATELYSRGWRFHKEERVWITSTAGMEQEEWTGDYYVFDVNSWRKVAKKFHLDFDKLVDKPSPSHSATLTELVWAMNMFGMDV